jgi:hypothetical protein
MWFLMLWTWCLNGANSATPSIDQPYDTGPVEEYAGPPR